VKSQSPLLGFNNNVKHRGRVFHIQTEDSGVRHPHVITHLFADGGRILKTTKTSYAEHLGASNLAETVRALMQEQHKAMFIALRDGQYDYLFDDKAPKPPAATPSSPTASGPSSSPTAPTSGAPPTSARAPVAPAPAPAAAPPPPPSAPRRDVPPPSTPRRDPPPVAPASRKITPRPKLDVDPRALQAQLQRSPGPLEVAATHTPIDIDLSALERAADEAQTPFFQPVQPDLPPPPAAVLGKKPDGRSITLTSYRSSSVSPPAGETPPPPESLGTPAPPGRVRSPTAPAPPGRVPSSPLAGGAGRLPSPMVGGRVPSSPRGTPPPGRLPTPGARVGSSPVGTGPRQMAPTMPMTSRPAGQPMRAPTSPLGVGSGPARTPTVPGQPPPRAGAPSGTGGSGRYAPTRPAAIFTPKKPADGSSIFGDDLISEKSLDEVILSYLAEDLDGDKK
jgi:hypothetical protein